MSYVVLNIICDVYFLYACGRFIMNYDFELERGACFSHDENK